MMKFILNKMNKFVIRIKMNHRNKRKNMVINRLSSQDQKIFHKVMSIARKNRESIKFDLESDEILISIPELFVLLNQHMVYVYNGNGFVPTEFPKEAYDILVGSIKRQAHIDRMKLKAIAYARLDKFIDKIVQEH